MRIEVKRLFDNDLRRKVYEFNVTIGISASGNISVKFTHYREERRLSRRHRSWLQLAQWGHWRGRDNTMPKPPQVPEDVSEEVLDIVTHSIVISNP